VPFDGKDNLAAFLPDGDYTANLVASRTLDTGDVASSSYAGQPFTIDNTALAPLDWKSSRSTIYPSPDGYRDTTTFTYGADRDAYTLVELRVRNASNTLVRTKLISVPADATWDGHRDDNSRVPAGTYTARLRVVDALGNIGLTPPVTVKVSDAALVTVTRKITVTPKASTVEAHVGSCSTRRTPSFHGWPGSTSYLSNSRCHRTFNASIVRTRNRVRLASAVEYLSVQLGWFGGPTNPASHHRGSATLYGRDGGPALGWFTGVDYLVGNILPKVPGSDVVGSGRYVYWGFRTNGGNRYDVKSFTVTYRAKVLR
jgi:flagellar hook assembly protein FlgD